ncbi:MAG: GNAT family N-acetyltransferase [Gemmataceae bacterium]
MIEFRPFRNPDPPALVELWNASLAGPRTVPLKTATLLEYFTLAKVYFDRRGLILATAAGKPVGFVHAGFASAPGGKELDRAAGVVCALGVLPSYRRQGIGSRLLTNAEDYLRGQGATSVTFGSQAPANPFLFGLHGGCTSAGVLSGDETSATLAVRHGYASGRRVGLFQRSLTRLTSPADARFAALRGQYDIIAGAIRRAGWWRECVLGPVEAVEYRLQDKRTGAVGARTVLWDMDTFCMHWGESCVGLIEMTVDAGLRRRGLGKYLLTNVLRHLRERSFHQFEAWADLDDGPSVGLLEGLEFTQVDTGTAYVKGA